MGTTNELTPEFKKAEQEIDNYYKSNSLIALPFATAAWSLMAFAENEIFRQVTLQITPQDLSNIGDNFINELKEPMYWLYRDCVPEGQIPSGFDTCNYNTSSNLLNLGQKYRWFEVAFTCHIQNVHELEIKGQIIQPAGDFFKTIEDGLEYEAYNHLVASEKSREVSTIVNNETIPIDSLQCVLKVDGDRFNCKLNHKMITDFVRYSEPFLEMMFLLPSSWEFSRYSLGEFRKVFEAILAMAVIRWNARIIAVEKGCQNMGYLDSIYLLHPNELLRRVVKYSLLPDETVLSIIEDLTYGSGGMKRPDPALQPLIRLNSQCYAIMPHLWLFSAAERNLSVLLNKIPDEKKAYSKLVNKKENLMRERIKSDLSNKDFKYISGKVKNLPDIDLAIVNHTEKACLLIELKWFIDPAEASEIIHRSKEIKKGISQVLKLTDAFENIYKPLLEKLNIDSNYTLEGVVVSENWIGNAEDQSPEVPVIRASHLIEKLKATDNLRSTIEWLKTRKYLPNNGEHFRIIRKTYTVGKWYLKWYRIESLKAFYP